jgi:hypothetical protein
MRRRAEGQLEANMSDQRIFNIEFGKLRYAPGAPKNASRWIWRCSCSECRAKALFHGPFRTKREAEEDAENACMLVASEPDGVYH